MMNVFVVVVGFFYDWIVEEVENISEEEDKKTQHLKVILIPAIKL